MTEIAAIGSTDRLLHIGPHKTGSTAIQVAMFTSRDRLAEHGVYYPGRKSRRGGASVQMFRAVAAGGGATPLWDALVREVTRAGEGRRVCVSDERFGKATPDQAARIVGDLGGGRAHVLAVARAYDRYLPSQWQERVKAGVTDSYEDWLRIVLDPGRSHSERRNVWHAHDTGALIERWTALVDPARFTLVVAEEGDRTQLPRVFEDLLALPRGVIELDPAQSNEGLSLAQVEALRAVNARLKAEEPPLDTYLWMVRQSRQLVRRAVPRSGPGRPLTPRWAREVVAARSAERVELLRHTDVHVVGDPERLLGLPVDEPIPGEGDGTPIEPDEETVAEVVRDVLRLVEQR